MLQSIASLADLHNQEVRTQFFVILHVIFARQLGGPNWIERGRR